MEMLYHYIWKHKIFPEEITLCDGRKIKIKSPGIHNTESGPDFSYARIQTDDSEWVGNVEIHVKASDWYRHGHQDDPAYDNVVLHAVAVDDTKIRRNDGSEIPQLVLPVNPELFGVYAELSRNIDDVKCLGRVKELPSLIVTDWLETLAVERIQMKAGRIKDLYRHFEYDWTQTLFATLARSLGFGMNGIPFEMLAIRLPLKYLLRHSDNHLQIESLLFGQAGFLDSSINIFDDYYQSLCREYFFLAKKYGLKPLQPGIWKTSTRPVNSPQRRLALLASALCNDITLFDRLLKCKGDVGQLIKIFSWEAGRYWEDHTVFNVEGKLPTRLSTSSIHSLLINLVAPFYTAYASICGEPEWAERSIDLLMNLPGEENRKTKQWKRGGLQYPDALRSQALIQLRDEYCDRGRCLECRFGHSMIRKAITFRPHNTELSRTPSVTTGERNSIVVAMDSWKGCMKAATATSAAAEGLSSRKLAVIEKPMADGGEGTAEILGKIHKGVRRRAKVTDPFGRDMEAEYYYDEETATAFIDFASASGLPLLSTDERNPLLASSYGTGQLIMSAKERGARRIILGLGGSATVDGGLGVLAALGARIYSDRGNLIEYPRGENLNEIGNIIGIDPGLELILLTDVNSPLTGANGAARTFGPQKGADPETVETLEQGMKRLETLMTNPDSSGYGAAGGAAGGLCEFAKGRIFPGAKYIITESGIEEEIRKAAFVVTGEGRADSQTLQGKVPGTILRIARKYGVPAVLVAGEVRDIEKLKAAGFKDIVDINSPYTTCKDVDVTDPVTARSRLRMAMNRILI